MQLGSIPDKPPKIANSPAKVNNSTTYRRICCMHSRPTPQTPICRLRSHHMIYRYATPDDIHRFTGDCGRKFPTIRDGL